MFNRRLVALFLAPFFWSLAGCSLVQVKVEKPSAAALRREALQVVRDHGRSPSPAARYLASGQRQDVSDAIRATALLEAARLSASSLPGTPDHEVNVAATRSLLALMTARKFAPISLGEGRVLSVSSDSRRTLDPRTANIIIPAEDILISRPRFRAVQEGAGLPCVVRFAPDSPVLQGQPGVPPQAGICEPVTVVVQPGERDPQLIFYRTLANDRIAVAGYPRILAADFTAPLAYMISRGRNRSFDVRSLIRVDRALGMTGLYQFSRFDPKKIPVVFVHGLMSRPETWMAAVNELMADEKVRERYQFWFFLYPTGLPVWASAAELRSELERYRKTLDPKRQNPKRQNPNFDRTVLVGHSRGG